MNFPIQHKDLYISASAAGGIATTISEMFIKHTPSHVLGVSLTLWVIIGAINMYDIHTGIKADTKRKEREGKKFVFESGKGWRAIEKAFMFGAVIYFIHEFEKEIIINDFPVFFSSTLLYLKFGMFFYVMLVELQSIGENEEERFGKKGRFFCLLDNVIDTVNKGILNKLKQWFNIDNSEPYV